MYLLKIKIFVFCLLIFLISSLDLFCHITSIQKQVIEKITSYQKIYHVPAMAVILIGRENHQKFEKIYSFGTLSKKSQIPVNEHSQFRIGSLTQLFIAASFAYLIEEGRVSLNDPITKFLPKSIKINAFANQPICLGDLATHTSALPNLPYNLSKCSAFNLNQMFCFLKNYLVKNAPGSQYHVSNLGYALLANILMRITKRSLPNLVNDYFIHPLHLEDTCFFLNKEQKTRLVSGYLQNQEISPTNNTKIYSVFIGSEGLYSTPQSMLKMLSFFMGKERTSLKSILKIMKTPYHQFKKFSIGLGWKIEPFQENSLLFSNGGELFGFSNFMGMVPKLDIGVVVLTNQEAASASLLGKELLELIHHSSH